MISGAKNNAEAFFEISVMPQTDENTAALIKLIDGIDVHARNACNQTPLHLAALYGSPEIVQLLLEKNADLEAKDTHGSTPLCEALAKSHFDIIRLLIDSGANIDAQNNIGDTALHYAVTHNHSKVIELLLDEGAKLDVCNNNGSTPLIACLLQPILEKNVTLGIIINKIDQLGRFDFLKENLSRVFGEDGLSIQNPEDMVEKISQFNANLFTLMDAFKIIVHQYTNALAVKNCDPYRLLKQLLFSIPSHNGAASSSDVPMPTMDEKRASKIKLS